MKRKITAVVADCVKRPDTDVLSLDQEMLLKLLAGQLNTAAGHLVGISVNLANARIAAAVGGDHA